MNAHKRKKLAKIAAYKEKLKQKEIQEVLVTKEIIEEKKVEEQKPQEQKPQEQKAEQTILTSDPAPVKKKKVVNEPV